MEGVPLVGSVTAPPADRDLVARCLAGDRVAQRRLFEWEKRAVHATLFCILGPSSQIDDLLEDVFLSVFRGLHTFRGESALSTWIDRCAVRKAFACMRNERGRCRLELAAEDVQANDPSAERRGLVRGATRRLYDTLKALEPNQRMAFTLHAIHGRPIAEVAELMGATVIATEARARRARRYVEKHAKADPVLAGPVVDGGGELQREKADGGWIGTFGTCEPVRSEDVARSVGSRLT